MFEALHNDLASAHVQQVLNDQISNIYERNAQYAQHNFETRLSFMSFNSSGFYSTIREFIKAFNDVGCLDALEMRKMSFVGDCSNFPHD